jgi:creatinine amidohydrolase
MPRHPDRLIERIAQPQAARLIEASGVAVVFAGSVEQHGGHLPLGTDAFAAQSIAERVAARLGTVAASLGPVGVAHYHGAWPGTLSLAPGTLIAVFNDVCGGLAAAGAHRIVSVNWHEGNSATLRLAADEAQQRHGVQVVMAETHVITHTLFPDEMEFTHAGSMETAAVLAFDPSLVHLESATPASDRTAGEAAHALFRRPDVYPVMRDFHDVAATGWYGRPELATPERAEEIAEAVADHVVRRAQEIWHALGEGDHRAIVPQASPPAPPFGAPPARPSAAPARGAR